MSGRQTSPSRGRVLVVEDDPAIAELLHEEIQAEGFEVTRCATGEDALDEVHRQAEDVIVLDLQLPGLSGLEVLRRLRERGENVRVIILTARAQEADRVRGLELGADDYVTKPFSVTELVSRIRALLRRRDMDETEAQALTFGSLRVDVVRHEATVDGQRVHLTPAELRIVALLIRRAGALVSRNDIVRELWGVDAPDQRAAYVHISNLRKKLDSVPGGVPRIVTVAGLGYRLVDAG